LRAFPPIDGTRPLVDHAALGRFARDRGLNIVVVADAIDAAIQLGWIEQCGSTGFVLTEEGREQLSVDRDAPEAPNSEGAI
jgi:hypothetical protein